MKSLTRFYLQGRLTSTGTSVAITNDNRGNVVSVTNESVVAISADKLTYEMMKVSCSGGIMTISSRGLDTSATVTEVPANKKERGPQTQIYITALAPDFVNAGANNIFTGANTRTANDIYHDVRTNATLKRVAVFNSITKNLANAGGVQFKIFTDADSHSVGNRTRQLWGYPLKSADGTVGGTESFFIAEFDTYDGAVTYTKKITINAPLTVLGQNRSGAWTSYTPVVSGSGGGSVGAYGSQVGYYQRYGKTCIYSFRVSVAKNTATGDIRLSLPFSATLQFQNFTATLGTSSSSTKYHQAEIDGSLTYLVFQKNLDVDYYTFADLGSTVVIKGTITYQIN